MAAIARTVKVSREAIRQTAARFDWASRAAAYDSSHASAAPSPAPERLQLAADARAVLPPATEDARAAEQKYLELLEQYRAAVEALGREQLVTARAMTAVAKRTAGRLLREERVLSPRDLPAFVNSMVNLASAGHAAWAKSIGVDRLLEQMELSLALAEADAHAAID
jgi:hypothetical protein